MKRVITFILILMTALMVFPAVYAETKLPADINSVATNDKDFVMVGNNGFIAMETQNGKCSTEGDFQDVNFNSIIYAKDTFYVVGTNGTILTSPNGKDWTKQEAFTERDFKSITYNGQLFVIVGSDGVVYTSEDGQTWKRRHFETDEVLTDVKWINKMFFATGSKLSILGSTDGVSWDTLNSDLTSETTLKSLIIYKDRIYAAGTDGTLLRSTDGSRWELTAVNGAKPNVNFNYMATDGSSLYLLGNDGQAFITKDGDTWDAYTLPTTKSIYSAAIKHDMALAVGAAGTVLTNRDSVNWINALTISSDIDEIKLTNGDKNEINAFALYPWGYKLDINKLATFEPSDPNIIQVSDTNKIKALKPGTAIVRVTFDTDYLEIKSSVWAATQNTPQVKDSTKQIPENATVDKINNFLDMMYENPIYPIIIIAVLIGVIIFLILFPRKKKKRISK